jgi:hypothetical protein
MPHPVAVSPAPAGDLLERPVPSVPVEGGWTELPLQGLLDRRSLDQEQIQPSVVVVVEESDPAPLGLEDVILAFGIAADVPKPNPGGVGHVDIAGNAPVRSFGRGARVKIRRAAIRNGGRHP